MKKLMTISAGMLLATSFSGAAFAQAGGNMNAPEPNASGTAIVQPGTTSSGVATDPHRVVGTTGMNTRVSPGNAEIGGKSGYSGEGSNSLANPNNTTGTR